MATIGEADLDRQLFRAGLAFIREHPRDWLALSGQKLISFWRFRPNIGTAYEEAWTRYYKPLYAK